MKNSPAPTPLRDAGQSPLSGSLPSVSPEKKASSAAQRPPQKIEARPDATLDVQLSSKLRDQSQAPAPSAPRVKPAATVEAYRPRGRDVVTRFMTWVATMMKKLEKRLLQRLETIPLLRTIIVPPKRDKEEGEDLS